MPDSLTHGLVNPNQLRAYGTTIQDNPFGGPMSLVDPKEIIEIPMLLDGTNVGFQRSTPSTEELDGLHLSSQYEWDPATMVVPRYNVSAVDTADVPTESYDDQDYEEVSNNDNFCKRLVASCRVLRIPRKRRVQEVVTDVKRSPTFVTEDQRADASPQSLADR
jgi:hypothetical protein